MKKKRNTDRKERVAGAIAQRIQRGQQRWADFMSKLVGRYSLRAQKRGFILCGLLLSAYSLYLIIEGFALKVKLEVDGREAIYIPKLLEHKEAGPNGSDSLIMATLKEFQHTRDSLLRHDPQQWQWIEDNRPGLLDSIEQLDIYITRKQASIP